ncbi:tRNA (adenosine(37)-N6)-threonylcarbamoyltransferase complex ATPase subunit type 1 TsaE [Erythrobacter sp.]|uniref:tRNA (adenosine(37)-N6)-threonylcarbamoyltransferase complex ATPase subunit type 1 TsaE n=1 Tax=Erythrobacter sp. TaxID=1042 RepID=UPI001B166DEF|nr:tRNA (adenosine(37)-N6)-threonylcarbamoyltransferase complex ATPase subunit type 1 TsaE [Erythrobacter sp.]MBO6526895.1 tRNA (adenosine(37)-N6)-threonylcarbamoyltransferase complex ATPase subunit type 1 TsaE [Erythrobacter sp.]MBO6528567.1 tRNA (adenosine(37)-N6)-threonylcarbamoyltransferase complex ATPase subunit type 1 TsaE [Erythrobacter sp.]
MRVSLPDLEAMEAFGKRIAERLVPGDVVSLSGTLGTGKTTLARAIISALGHVGEVPSPTYTIIETYDDTHVPLVHADFYRLEDPAEVEEIGLDDYREGAALLAEWPDNAGGFAHEAGCLSIALEKVGEGREAVVTPGTSWQSRWP